MVTSFFFIFSHKNAFYLVVTRNYRNCIHEMCIASKPVFKNTELLHDTNKVHIYQNVKIKGLVNVFSLIGIHTLMINTDNHRIYCYKNLNRCFIIIFHKLLKWCNWKMRVVFRPILLWVQGCILLELKERELTSFEFRAWMSNYIQYRTMICNH